MKHNLTDEQLAIRDACVQAIRARAGYLEDSGYPVVAIDVIRHAAYWLGSDEGLFAVCSELDAGNT